MLSNHTIATLSQYVHKARASLAVVKVSDLVNDQRYAFGCFIQTVLSEDEVLVTLTLQANSEMNIEKHLIIALDTYFKQLKLLAKNHAVIQSNQSFLIKLATCLYGVNVDGNAYRQAVDQLLTSIDNIEKHFCVDIARSFYPHWINAYKTLTDEAADQSENAQSQEESLMELWNDLDHIRLSSIEDKALMHYSAAMKHTDLLDKEIDVRVKIAKVILIEQQKYNATAEDYRANIDALQKRFSSVRLRDYVLAVSREFYRFWADTYPSK